MNMSTSTIPKGVVVLISSSPELRQTLRAWLEPLAYSVITFDSAADWKNSPERNRKDYIGVWIELKGLLGLPQEVRNWLTLIEETFPVVKIIAQKTESDYSANVSGEIIKGRDAILKTFANTTKFFDPRGIRSHHRVQIHHRVRIRPTDTLDWLNCNTFNLSHGGAMLTNLGSQIPYSKDQVLILEFVDFPEIQAISAEVMWALPWEKVRTKLPGLGIRFKDVGPDKIAPLLMHK
jgi:hypothetical protein